MPPGVYCIVLLFHCSQNADVLKSHPDILKTISDHLFGVLDGFVNIRYVCMHVHAHVHAHAHAHVQCIYM